MSQETSCPFSRIKGETLICDFAGGTLTTFGESFDITAGEHKLEVKYSNLGVAVKGSLTRRWSWSKVLGWKDEGKNYGYLVLIGEKGIRFPNQYLDATPYVCFLIPRENVEALMFKGDSIGGIIQLTTNFSSVRNKKSKMLLDHMVKIEDISLLLKHVQSANSALSTPLPPNE